MSIFVALRQKVCEISAVKNFFSPEKSAKVHQVWGLSIGQTPNTAEYSVHAECGRASFFV